MLKISIVNFLISATVFFVFYGLSFRKELAKYWIPYIKLKKKIPSIRQLSIICITVYGISVVTITWLLQNLLASLMISVLPSLFPFIIFDIYKKYQTNKEQQQVTSLVMVLSKWSLLKNDLIYCLKKASFSDLKNPVKGKIKTAYLRINTGMTIDKALNLLEDEAFGDNLKYLVKNIRFSAKKGGDLSALFKSAEEQYFAIDEELFKRKISSFRDQITIYCLMLFVIVLAIWFISNDKRVMTFYLETGMGQNFIGLFCLMYALATLLVVRK
ncbi:MAG: hypothetical protein KAG94_04380 [Clostridiales bacterium]|nr:hypothetical protein [Clostridiales bacterium]